MSTNPIGRIIFIVLMVLLCGGIAVAFSYINGLEGAAMPLTPATAQINPLESVVAQMREENETLRLQIKALETDLQIEREKTNQLQAQAKIIEAGGTADFQRQVGSGVSQILEANA